MHTLSDLFERRAREQNSIFHGLSDLILKNIYKYKVLHKFYSVAINSSIFRLRIKKLNHFYFNKFNLDQYLVNFLTLVKE